MHKLLVVSCLLAAMSSASAMPASDSLHSDPMNTLLNRALGLDAESRETRPAGQCIVSCGERMVTLKRCPDGDCPQFDCNTGYASCGAR